MDTLSVGEGDIGDPSVPVSSLYLLVPPLHLLSAVMWQILQQKHILHYGKLEEFVSLVVETFPELLSESQRTELTLGLQISCKTDPALEVLLWELLSKLEQLLPVPDLKQTVSWLSAAPSVLEICVQSVSYPDQLKSLLRHHRSLGQLDIDTTPPSMEERKIPSLSHPPSQRVLDSNQLTNTTTTRYQSRTDWMNCLSPISSGDDLKAEPAIDDSYHVGSGSSFNRCVDTKEETERTTGYLMSRGQKDRLSSRKDEEEDAGTQSVKMESKDGARYEEVHGKGDKERDEQREGLRTDQAAQTDTLVQNGGHSEYGQEGEEPSTLLISCLLKQPRVLIRRLVSSQVLGCSQRPFVHTKRARLHQLTEKVHPEELSSILGSHHPPNSTHQQPTPPKTLPTQTQSQTNTPKSRTCPNCGECFKSRSLMRAHKKIHKIKRVFQCSQCGKIFSRAGNFIIHQRIHTGERPYHCSQCGKTFSRSDKLKNHERIHSGERPYHCPQCRKSFIALSNLRQHQKIHSDLRPYPCLQCGKSFTESNKLKVHQRRHTGERPYHCFQCGRSFIHLSTLKKHHQTHSGEHHCGSSFHFLGNLKQHKKSHTGKPLFHCSQCGKSYSYSGSLIKHQRNHTTSSTKGGGEDETEALIKEVNFTGLGDGQVIDCPPTMSGI